MRAADRAAGSTAANHLVIHNLCCPDDQTQEFADCIGRLAELGAVWQSIHYVSAATLRRLSTAALADGWSVAAASLQECIGVGTADELFLGQNLLVINQLLYRAYPDAVRDCYGDGIGLNFSHDYYRVPAAPRKRWGVDLRSISLRSVGRRLKRNIRHRIRCWRGIAEGPLQPSTEACHSTAITCCLPTCSTSTVMISFSLTRPTFTTCLRRTALKLNGRRAKAAGRWSMPCRGRRAWSCS